MRTQWPKTHLQQAAVHEQMQAAALQARRESRERGREFPRHGGLPARGVELLGIREREAEAFADFPAPQVLDPEPVRPIVWERDVALGVAEVGEEVELRRSLSMVEIEGVVCVGTFNSIGVH